MGPESWGRSAAGVVKHQIRRRFRLQFYVAKANATAQLDDDAQLVTLASSI
jgi:hypothetical protein